MAGLRAGLAARRRRRPPELSREPRACPPPPGTLGRESRPLRVPPSPQGAAVPARPVGSSVKRRSAPRESLNEHPVPAVLPGRVWLESRGWWFRVGLVFLMPCGVRASLGGWLWSSESECLEQVLLSFKSL